MQKVQRTSFRSGAELTQQSQTASPSLEKIFILPLDIAPRTTSVRGQQAKFFYFRLDTDQSCHAPPVYLRASDSLPLSAGGIKMSTAAHLPPPEIVVVKQRRKHHRTIGVVTAELFVSSSVSATQQSLATSFVFQQVCICWLGIPKRCGWQLPSSFIPNPVWVI